MEEYIFNAPIQFLFERNGVSIYIKRDDMIHPFISGNKWRKLKYVIEDARLQHKSKLVSFGGAYSNHLAALACAGALYKFKTIAFVRGEKVSNQMLSLCEMWGMELRFVSREVYKSKEQLFHDAFANDHEAYFIDEGGKGTLAAKGCGEIVNDLDTSFTHIISAVGTGTTIAGIAQKANLIGIKAEGICALKGAEGMDEEIATLAGLNVKIHHQFHRGGYAKTDPELMHFIKDFAAQTSIILDQVYTGKMMMAVLSLIDEGYYKPNDKLLVVHTGGLLGLLSQL